MSPTALQGDAISDTVNLAPPGSKGLTKLYGTSLLISETVKVQLKSPDRYTLRFLDWVIVLKVAPNPLKFTKWLDAEAESSRRLKLDTPLRTLC